MEIFGELVGALGAFGAEPPPAVLAYVGPGTGLAVIGAALAFVAGILMGVLGFIWYPLKRVYRALAHTGEPAPEPPAE